MRSESLLMGVQLVDVEYGGPAVVVVLTELSLISCSNNSVLFKSGHSEIVS